MAKMKTDANMKTIKSGRWNMIVGIGTESTNLSLILSAACAERTSPVILIITCNWEAADREWELPGVRGAAGGCGAARGGRGGREAGSGRGRAAGSGVGAAGGLGAEGNANLIGCHEFGDSSKIGDRGKQGDLDMHRN